MRLRRIRTKSDAVRVAVLEAVEREKRSRHAPAPTASLHLEL